MANAIGNGNSYCASTYTYRWTLSCVKIEGATIVTFQHSTLTTNASRTRPNVTSRRLTTCDDNVIRGVKGMLQLHQSNRSTSDILIT